MLNESHMTHYLTHIFLLLAVISPPSYLWRINIYLIITTPRNRTVFLIPITPDTTFNYILAVSNKTKKSKDDFSIDLLQKLAPHIAIPLAHIYNCSVQNGVFPEKMKISRIIPIYIFKSEDPLDPENYRSIFMINVFSKIVEKDSLGISWKF